MDIAAITQLIGSLGFPIACCIYLIYSNNKANEEVIFDDDNISFDSETNILTIKTENELQKVEEQTEEILKEEEIDKLRQTVENNTKVMIKICTKLGVDSDD